ncbi:MAG: polysaccharide biosynthesis C-terminal domain-containing protein [Lentisphaeria bacterium]|nr:polysaccharide biosynthesis C-terminal domain-containing protein [Lentisphaeria bacterium]
MLSCIYTGCKHILKKTGLSSGEKPYTLFSNRDIFRLVIPLFFEQLLFLLVGSIDVLMVASLGEASISAVSLVDMFNNCIGSIIFALATGGAVVASQYLGAGKILRARESAKQLLAIVLIAGCAVMLAGEVFMVEIIRLIYGKLPADVYENVLSYFRITLLTFPFVSVYGGCTALFRTMNRTKVTMYISLISNIINVVGNALLIYVFKMGVTGAACATLLARILAMVIIVFMITDRSESFSLNSKRDAVFQNDLSKRSFI